MRIISEKTIRKFWLKNRDAEMAMREWMTAVRQTDWQSFADVRQTFNHADVYKNCTIFDVGGNKYRIIAKINYRKHTVFIRFVLTHDEYGFRHGKHWNFDCE
jgi:mRNA interferase HigB